MSLRPINLVLVEDNPGDANLLRLMLEETGSAQFEIAVAPRLSELQPLLSEGSVDAILLDLPLPDSHGLDTLGSVRAIAPAVAIVVMVGLEDEALGVQAVRASAQHYLVKDNDIGIRPRLRRAGFRDLSAAPH